MGESLGMIGCNRCGRLVQIVGATYGCGVVGWGSKKLGPIGCNKYGRGPCTLVATRPD